MSAFGRSPISAIYSTSAAAGIKVKSRAYKEIPIENTLFPISFHVGDKSAPLRGPINSGNGIHDITEGRSVRQRTTATAGGISANNDDFYFSLNLFWFLRQQEFFCITSLSMEISLYPPPLPQLYHLEWAEWPRNNVARRNAKLERLKGAAAAAEDDEVSRRALESSSSW